MRENTINSAVLMMMVKQELKFDTSDLENLKKAILIQNIRLM